MRVTASLLAVLGYSLRGGLALNCLWPAGFPVVLWRLGQKGMMVPAELWSVLEGVMSQFLLASEQSAFVLSGRESCDCSSPPCNLLRELYQ